MPARILDFITFGRALLPPHSELSNDGGVADSIEKCVFRFTKIGMRMPSPTRNDENIVLCPLDPCAADF